MDSSIDLFQLELRCTGIQDDNKDNEGEYWAAKAGFHNLCPSMHIYSEQCALILALDQIMSLSG